MHADKGVFSESTTSCYVVEFFGAPYREPTAESVRKIKIVRPPLFNKDFLTKIKIVLNNTHFHNDSFP